MSVKIYHNPRCSKSRQTLELLSEKNLQPEIIKYLETPPNADELSDLLNLLKLQPRQLMRTHEKEYRAAGADHSELTRDQLINIMINNPKLIERPIVIANGKAAIGRPIQQVIDIL